MADLFLINLQLSHWYLISNVCRYLRGKQAKQNKTMVRILLPKLFWPTVRKKCSSYREKLLKFEAEGQEFPKFLRSLEQFIQTVKGTITNQIGKN